MNTKIVLFLLFISAAYCAMAAQEPTGMVMIFRHGARGPVGNTWEKTWGTMYGELTPVGMRQQYLRGAYLAQQYPQLFSKYDPTVFSIRSTDVNRTLMSAYSLLDGLFNGKGPVFPDNYPFDLTYPLYQGNYSDTEKDVLPHRFQTVPIHTLETNYDELLKSYQPTVCPLASTLILNQTNDPTYQALVGKFKQTISEISQLLNFTTDLSVDQLDALLDALIANHFEGKPLAGGIDLSTDLGKNLTFLISYSSYFLNAGSSLQRQLFSMNPLNQFKDDIDSILKGSKTTIRLYSAHDSTLQPILAVTGIATHECLYKNFFENGTFTSCYFPRFASALRFEVWKNDTDQDASEIRVYFDEAPQNLCQSATGHCTWKAFKTLLQNYTQNKDIQYFRTTCNSTLQPHPDNANTTNGSSNSNGNGTDTGIPDGPYVGLKYAVYALTGVAGILFVGIIYAIGKRKDNDSKADGFLL